MGQFNLTADLRSLDEKTNHLRNNKKIPAVIYGKNQTPLSITLDYSEFLKTFRKAGESNIIVVKVADKEIEVLVHDFQQEPVSGDYTHVDFYAVTRGEALTTKIHLNFVGAAPAVKEGGILEELHKEVEVKCLPKDLVDHFDVDLSILTEVGQNIKASDLKLDEKFELITPADEVLVLIGKSRAEQVSDEAPEAPAMPGDEEKAAE